MKSIKMKEDNVPTTTGYYICIQMGRSKIPQLVDIRIDRDSNLIFHAAFNCSFPLKELDSQHCLWSDEIELTETVHLS